MKKLLLVILCILFISSVNALYTESIFNETFGNSNFAYDNSNCTDFPISARYEGLSKWDGLDLNYTVSQTWDNNFACGSNRFDAGVPLSIYGGTTDGNLAVSNVSLVYQQNIYSTSRFLYHEFTTDTNLNGFTNFSLSCRQPSNTVGSFVLNFYKSTGESFSLCIAGDCISGFYLNNTFDIDSLYDDQCSNSTSVQNVTFNMQDVYDLTGLTTTNTSNLHSFELYYWNSGNWNYAIDDFSFNKFNGTNELPEVNVSFETLLCFNNTAGFVTTPINISAYDPEGDTILYFDSNTKKTKEIEVGFSNDLLFQLFSFYTFKDKTRILFDGQCLINDKNEYNSTKLDLQSAYNFVDSPTMALNIFDTCAGNRSSVIFDLGGQYLDYYLETNFLDFKNNESFNVSFYDISYNLIQELNFYNENDRFLIYSNSTLIVNESISKVKDQQKFYFLISTFGFSSNSTLYIGYENVTEIYNIPYIDTGFVKFFEVFSSSGNILLDDFRYGGLTSTEIIYSSTKPSNLTITNTGLYSYNLYYTDNVNQLTDFGVYNVNIVVQEENYCLESIGLLTPNNELQSDFTNPNNYSGVRLYFAQLIWLLQFPYRLMLYFDMLVIFQGAGLLSLIFLIGNLFSRGVQLNRITTVAGIYSIFLYSTRAISEAVVVPFIFFFVVFEVVKFVNGDSNGE